MSSSVQPDDFPWMENDPAVGGRHDDDLSSPRSGSLGDSESVVPLRKQSKWQKLRRLDRWSKALLSLQLFEAIWTLLDETALSLEVERERDDAMWWLGLTVINGVASVYFSFSAVLFNNQFDLYVFLALSALTLLRTGFVLIWKLELLDHDEDASAVTISIISFVVFALVQAGFVLISLPLRRRMLWSRFRNWGGDSDLRAMLRTYNQFLSLLKFSVVMSVMMIWTGLVAVMLGASSHIAVASAVVLVLEALWLLLGLKSHHGEHHRLALLFEVSSIITAVYIVFVTVKFESYETDETLPSSVVINSIVLAAVAVLLRLCVLRWSLVLSRRVFGRGLKERVLDVGRGRRGGSQAVVTSAFKGLSFDPNAEEHTADVTSIVVDDGFTAPLVQRSDASMLLDR